MSARSRRRWYSPIDQTSSTRRAFWWIALASPPIDCSERRSPRANGSRSRSSGRAPGLRSTARRCSTGCRSSRRSSRITRTLTSPGELVCGAGVACMPRMLSCIITTRRRLGMARLLSTIGRGATGSACSLAMQRSGNCCSTAWEWSRMTWGTSPLPSLSIDHWHRSVGASTACKLGERTGEHARVGVGRSNSRHSWGSVRRFAVSGATVDRRKSLYFALSRISPESTPLNVALHNANGTARSARSTAT